VAISWMRVVRGASDLDADGITDGVDNCSTVRNGSQADVDRDGIGNECDNCPGVANPDQSDSDGNGIGDACENDGPARFLRGDSNADGALNISDASALLNWLFLGGEPIFCEDAADGNDDGAVDISDAISVLGYLFLGGAAPPAPGANACGEDPTSDDLPPCQYPASACE
ncbi:MAG TPA: thrombospondin type 3 repeat-containing protein, partial [Planctomycetota bacterium]|nr:thrombospondin type 3 repeat-containing protein [Planctomycetota bacterium]